MIVFRKPVLLRIIACVSVVFACLSLAFGNNVGVLVSSRVIAELKMVDGPSLPQQSSLPEEAPSEGPSPEEPTEENEAPSLSLRKKTQKALKTHFRFVDLTDLYFSKTRPVQVVFTLYQTLPQFEYGYRNGCGAHLRC